MLFHMSRHEDKEVDFYQCNQCQNQFKKKEKLEQHMVKKHGGGFQCETCGRKFPEQSILKEHKRVHTRERPHQCTECGATFSFQSTFISHRKMHLREQGITEEEAKVRLYYFCDICEKSYANPFGEKRDLGYLPGTNAQDSNGDPGKFDGVSINGNYSEKK